MVRPAQEDGMREIFGDFGGGMGAFQAWVASSRHPSQGEGEVSSSRRRRQLVVAGLAASLAGTAFCYYALGSGASSRSLGGAWDAGRESMLQAANRHGVVKASRVSPHGELKELQRERPLAGTHTDLLYRQPSTHSKHATQTKEQLTFDDGCKGTISKVGEAFSCGGPIHEDSGMMDHENHCMIFSKHDWDFQGVASDFQGGDDGSNGDLGCLMDPGTEYCLSALLHPWDGMVGLEVCNRTDDAQLWTKEAHVNGVVGFMTEGNHKVTTYSNELTGMMLDKNCHGKCYDVQVCLPRAKYRREVNDHDFLTADEEKIFDNLPEDPTAPIR